MFLIDEGHGVFAREYPRKAVTRRQLHLGLSVEGAKQLESSIQRSLERLKQSTVVFPCNRKPSALAGRIHKVRYFHSLHVVVLAEQDDSPSEFSELNDQATLRVNRTDVPILRQICKAIVDGMDDTAFVLGDSEQIWIWGPQGPW